LSDVEVNTEWTLESMKETLEEKEDWFSSVCYSCSASKNVKEFIIAVRASKMMWQDGDGPVWEKYKVHYCKDCAKKIIKDLEEPIVTQT
jgi:hypothetical protein